LGVPIARRAAHAVDGLDDEADGFVLHVARPAVELGGEPRELAGAEEVLRPRVLQRPPVVELVRAGERRLQQRLVEDARLARRPDLGAAQRAHRRDPGLAA
jgi:hypothetical protein